MALALGVKKGEKIYFNGLPMHVDRYGSSHCDVTFSGKTWRLTDTKSVEIMSGVFASVARPNRESRIRLLFEAPKHIKILRGSIYETEAGSRLSDSD